MQHILKMTEAFKDKMAKKLEKERDEKRAIRAMRERRREIEIEHSKMMPEKKVSGDVLRYCVKGIYMLYRGSEVVYVGMSADNCMQRICDHYREANKQFDSFTIEEHNISDEALRAKEKALIRTYRPVFNKAHKEPVQSRSVFLLMK